MKQHLTNEICNMMERHLDQNQNDLLRKTLDHVFCDLSLPNSSSETALEDYEENTKLINLFIAAKKIEGCSPSTLKYYSNTITKMVDTISKNVRNIETNDLRYYLSTYQNTRNCSKSTLDNIRRILSTFYAWLEDEDYIQKSPVRRIHKVKTTKVVKETFTDEHLEQLRDNCSHPRDRALLDLLVSTGIRVGELVHLNRSDINFVERECVVLGKGDKERPVYFDAKTKIHLEQYLESRVDSNPALFVTKHSPWRRLTIAGVESFLQQLGANSDVKNVHPHKFRRTMATMAIEKGMPIEQVQKLLGHSKIDTTLHYAIVNQSNVKIAHRRYIG